MVKQLSDFYSELGEIELRQFAADYYIPFAVRRVVPGPRLTVLDFPVGKIGVYTRFFEFANQRVPLSIFLCDILSFYSLHISSCTL